MLGPTASGTALSTATAATGGRVEAEVDEEAAPVVAVLLDPVIELLDLSLVEEAQHLLLQGATALARDDLDEGGLLLDRLVDDPAQGPIDLVALVEDVVQVQL